MSFEQKESLQKLLSTNKSIFGNHNIIEIDIHRGTNEKSILQEELNSILSAKQSR